MGLFDKIRQAVGGVDAQLLQTGRLGRGLVLGVQLTGTTVEMGGPVERACVFTLQVSLDDVTPYDVTVRQRVPEYLIAQFQPGQSVVAVRVDPADPNRVVIDFASAPPTVRLPQGAGQGSAAEILATGNPCEVVIVQSQPLGMQNASGVDLYAFLLTVFPGAGAPYQIQVGNPVPTAAVPLLFPGSRLPAKVSPGEPNSVAIDWAGAMAKFGG